MTSKVSPFYFIQNTTTQHLSGALTLSEAVVELAKIRLLGTDSAVIVDNELYVVPQSEWRNIVPQLTAK